MQIKIIKEISELFFANMKEERILDQVFEDLDFLMLT